MRLFALLALVVALPLAACCGQGFGVRSPFYSAPQPPELVPTGYGIRTAVTQTYGLTPLPAAAGACAPAPAPSYTSGYRFQAPPVAAPAFGDCGH